MDKPKKMITVRVSVVAPVETVWKKWTNPDDITKWNFASDDWHAPSAVNNLEIGGVFSYRMAAKDGSAAFDFEGTYTNVIPHKRIDYTIADGRLVSVQFESNGNQTIVTESFEAENVHPPEVQQQGWQAILNNFKNHVES